MPSLSEQTQAGLGELRRLRDTTPNLGLRIWLTVRIDEIESMLNRGGVLPQPIRVWRGRKSKSMRRVQA